MGRRQIEVSRNCDNLYFNHFHVLFGVCKSSERHVAIEAKSFHKLTVPKFQRTLLSSAYLFTDFLCNNMSRPDDNFPFAAKEFSPLAQDAAELKTSSPVSPVSYPKPNPPSLTSRELMRTNPEAAERGLGAHRAIEVQRRWPRPKVKAVSRATAVNRPCPSGRQKEQRVVGIPSRGMGTTRGGA